MWIPLRLFYTGQMDVSENSSSDESDSNADSDSDATIALHDPVPCPTLFISTKSATDAVNEQSRSIAAA